MQFGGKAYLTSLTYGEAKTYEAPADRGRLGLWAAIFGALGLGVGIVTTFLSWGIEIFGENPERDPLSVSFAQSIDASSPFIYGLGAGVAVWVLGFSVANWVHKRRVQAEIKAAREHFMEQVGAEKFLQEVPTFNPSASGATYVIHRHHMHVPSLESLAREIHRNKSKLSRGTAGRSPDLPADVGNRIMKELADVLVRQTVATDARERGQISAIIPNLFYELNAASDELDEAANRAHYG